MYTHNSDSLHRNHDPSETIYPDDVLKNMLFTPKIIADRNWKRSRNRHVVLSFAEKTADV